MTSSMIIYIKKPKKPSHFRIQNVRNKFSFGDCLTNSLLFNFFREWDDILYSTSYHLYALSGFLICLIVCLFVSLISRICMREYRPVEPMLLHPLVRYIFFIFQYFHLYYVDKIVIWQKSCMEKTYIIGKISLDYCHLRMTKKFALYYRNYFEVL